MNSTTLVPMIAILVLHTIFFLAGGHIIDTAHKSKENVGGVFDFG